MRTPRPWALPQHPALREHLPPGVTEAMIRTQLEAGKLVRLRSKVFLDAGLWPEDPAAQNVIRARAEQVARPDAVLSHQSAALVWGLPTPDVRPWHVLAPALTLPSRSGYRSRRDPVRYVTGALPAHHVTRDPAGYQVTTPVRTAMDLAIGLSLPEALVLLDAAARQVCGSLVATPRRSDYANPRMAGLAREAMSEVADVLGVISLRTAISLVDPRRETPIESLTAGHLRLAGLPMPDFQRRISTAIGDFFVDCYWEGSPGLIGEADGAVKYNRPGEAVDEKVREQALRDTGERMVRWLGKEILFRPPVVMTRVANALGL